MIQIVQLCVQGANQVPNGKEEILKRKKEREKSTESARARKDEI